MTANSFQTGEFKLKCQFWFSEDGLLSKYLRKIFSLKPRWLEVRVYKCHGKFHHLVERLQALLDKSWNFIMQENTLITNIHVSMYSHINILNVCESSGSLYYNLSVSLTNSPICWWAVSNNYWQRASVRLLDTNIALIDEMLCILLSLISFHIYMLTPL